MFNGTNSNLHNNLPVYRLKSSELRKSAKFLYFKICLGVKLRPTLLAAYILTCGFITPDPDVEHEFLQAAPFLQELRSLRRKKIIIRIGKSLRNGNQITRKRISWPFVMVKLKWSFNNINNERLPFWQLFYFAVGINCVFILFKKSSLFLNI